MKNNIVSLSTLALALLSIVSVSNGASLMTTKPAPIASPTAEGPYNCPPPLLVCAFESSDATQ